MKMRYVKILALKKLIFEILIVNFISMIQFFFIIYYNYIHLVYSYF